MKNTTIYMFILGTTIYFSQIIESLSFQQIPLLRK
jgi:hypothetical protein